MQSYTCAMCEQTFEKSWSDEEARQERDLIFGIGYEDKDCALVCDDCFQKIKPVSYKEARLAIRKDMAQVYLKIKNKAIRRLYWKMNKEMQKKMEDFILYGEM
jgi:hypothetical protein